MPIRWSALQVSERLDELEKLLGEAEPLLVKLAEKAQETYSLPHVPDYIGQPLGWLKQKTLDFTAGQKQRINKARDYIPEDALAQEKAQFDKLVNFWNGDREKALLSMNLGKPKKETPKEQARFVFGGNKMLAPEEAVATQESIETGYETRTVKDYIYCEDCQMFVDLWKYDSIEDAGHGEHSWRYVTEEELEECVADCEESGCFEENML